MNSTKRMSVLASGMAIFAMFFGAGNIIFPLALGQFALDKTPYALVGLLITAVAMPFIGLLTMFLYKGEIAPFFYRIGKIPGLILACFVISLLGPVGCAPRCIALAYSTLSMSFSGLNLVVFSLISCALVFLCAYNKGRFLTLLGYVLSPCKIFLLLLVIVIGLLNIPEMKALVTNHTEGTLIVHGLTVGYNTMDLLGAFFFAPVVIASLGKKEELAAMDQKKLGAFLLKATGIGAALISIVYVGFCYLTAIYAPHLTDVPMDKLLGAIAIEVLGPIGGLIVGLTVVVSCFTTTVALVTAFASFVQKEVLPNVGYIPIVVGSLVVTFLMTTLEFRGIVAVLTPVLELCYPVLIAFTAYNLFHALVTSKKKVPQEV